MRAFMFYVITIALFPVTAAGYLAWLGTILMAGQASGVSATAQGPLSARYFQHKFRLRHDDAARRLMMALPVCRR